MWRGECISGELLSTAKLGHRRGRGYDVDKWWNAGTGGQETAHMLY